MEYRGSFRLFDPSRIRTYPLRVRASKVGLDAYVERPSDRCEGTLGQG
jgi:hypothetical protein